MLPGDTAAGRRSKPSKKYGSYRTPIRERTARLYRLSPHVLNPSQLVNT